MLRQSKVGPLRNPPSPISRQRGVYGLIFAVLLIPLIAAAGFAIDYGRVVEYKGDLQNAVDEAALAGATVFISNSAASISSAETVATNYFNHAILPPSLVLSAPTVTTNSAGTLNPALGSGTAYTVTVSATATIANTLFSMFIPSVTLSATGTAGDPNVIVNTQVETTHVSAQACDGNTVYLYMVPKAANGIGYNYAAVPAFSTANYQWIGSSMGSATAPPGQIPLAYSANQPLGIALLNTTNGNTGNSTCGVGVTGANSYGSPNGGSQMFYSTLLANGQSPSENSNSTYPVQIVTTTHSGNAAITQVSITPPAAPGQTTRQQVYSGNTLAPSPYNIQVTYTGGANCVVNSTSTSGSNTTTNYSCTTQYRQQTSNSSSYAPNCSLYVQTGVSQSYINSLSNSSSAPSAALGQCSTVSGGGAQYAAPTCAQLSALGNTTTGTAPGAVFWWDDAGGVGQGEQYYSPSNHCSQMSSSSAGYGEDCQYKNNFFAATCVIAGGGTNDIYTEVVLTQ